MAEQQMPNGVFSFKFPPGLMVEGGKARRLTAKEWSYVEGVMLMRKGPDNQNQQAIGDAWTEEHLARCIVELDGVRIDNREQILDLWGTWDAPTIRTFDAFFKKLDGPTMQELEAHDFFGEAATAETSSPSPSE